MTSRRSSRLAEKKEVPETSNKITLEDVSSSSDPEWDDVGSDYEVETRESDNVSSEGGVSLGCEEEGGIGDDRAPDEFESAVILESPQDSVAAEIEDFWLANYPEIDTIPTKIAQMEKAGYTLTAHFILPENCWTEHFYAPQFPAQ